MTIVNILFSLTKFVHALYKMLGFLMYYCVFCEQIHFNTIQVSVFKSSNKTLMPYDNLL